MNKFELGIPVVDLQHQKYFTMVDDFAANLGEESSDIETILKEIKTYAVAHFRTEEKLMAKYNYPHLDVHIRLHEEFKIKIEEYQGRLKGDNPPKKNELMSFLRLWMRTHVLQVDRQYADILRYRMRKAS